MSFYVNTASPASSGFSIPREPDYATSIEDEYRIIGGTDDTLDGNPSLDIIARPRTRRFEIHMLTNSDHASLITKLKTNGTTYWQFPHESADTTWLVRQAWKSTPRKLKGDSATAPHWDVTNIVLDEVI